MRAYWVFLLLLVTSGSGPFAIVARADGPDDNLPDRVRRIPPPGIAVPAADRAELEAGVAELGQEIDALRAAAPSRPAGAAAGRPARPLDVPDLLPDVQIYYNAVRYALTYDEFFQPREIAVAKALLKQGQERARALRDGQAPWTTAVGLVVRGYLSRIDGSVQPYGLVVPASYQSGAPTRHRLDVWFHGRGETLSELSFLQDRQRSPGEFTPPDTFVLHPYGRYCNANRFAGEVDLFEALEHVRKHYPIDEDRLAVRGFSMGGAACWQFAVHFAGQWAAAAPGAGFSETADFLKVFQNESVQPSWYEQKLWHLYDSVDYAVNLFNCPTVAYSGEIDGQKQAADRMAEALRREGIELVHIIGPQTRHAYHPQSKEEIDRRVDAILARGRNPMPRHVLFTTWTLRYDRMLWVQVDGLKQHWERARVDAEILDPHTVKVNTANVTALTLSMPPGLCPLEQTRRPKVLLDRQTLEAPPVLSDRSWTAHFRLVADRWTVVASPDDGTLRKRHSLQGPIDDAFMDSFLMVRPTGTPLNERVGAWAAAEQKHAIEHWRRQFRGEARVKDDRDVTPDDIAGNNLILWGDPSSNQVLAKIVARLPVHWDGQGVRVGARTYPADRALPVLIYPNPLNPRRYVVLNSGFTFREYDYLNNARQTPKLPDYAVVDVSVPPTSRAPGGILDAGFFGERWELLPSPPPVAKRQASGPTAGPR
jgi:Prolyl oligopeptidase family